jgi:hypothetical protein
MASEHGEVTNFLSTYAAFGFGQSSLLRMLHKMCPGTLITFLIVRTTIHWPTWSIRELALMVMELAALINARHLNSAPYSMESCRQALAIAVLCSLEGRDSHLANTVADECGYLAQASSLDRICNLKISQRKKMEDD